MTGSQSGALAICLLALAVRGFTLFAASESLRDDPDGYRRLARSVVASRGTDYHDELDRRAYRPPLYPLLLAAVGASSPDSIAAVALLHLVLGVATAWLSIALARRWRFEGGALWAGALVACDPLLLWQSTLVMTESLATLLAVVLLHGLTTATRRPSTLSVTAAAVMAGMAVLCRPTFLAVALLTPALIVPGFDTARRRATATAVYCAALLATLAPWMVWTYAQLGAPRVTTTHGGYTLLLGNNPHFYRYLREGSWGEAWNAAAFHDEWQTTAEEVRANSPTPSAAEIGVDRTAYRLAWRNIRDEPGMFLYGCLVRMGRFWGLLPHRLAADETTSAALARWSVAVWYLAVYGLAVYAMIQLRGRLVRFPWVWGLLLAVTFTAVHTVYWSNLRMRAPVMPVVALLAGQAAGRFWERYKSPKDVL